MSRVHRSMITVALVCASAFAQTAGAKLDHVVIAVRDLRAAKRIYTDLGFSITGGGRHPTGTENSIAFLSGGGYLELITPYDLSLPGGRNMAESLKNGEGALRAGLEIASAEQAARDLSAAGLKINGPTPGTIVIPGEKEPPPTRWWSLTFADRIASRPLFLIQYVPGATPLPAPPRHPNSASSMSALLIAVNDVQVAAAGYGSIGTANDREIPLPEFGAVGKEIVLEKGSIMLLRASDPSGPTARRLKEHGEGILGVRMVVTDLDEARKRVGQKNVSKEKMAVLVVPENAAGVWLKFQAAH